jgi:hypothetical protein
MQWLEAIARWLPDVKLAVIGAGWTDPTKGTRLQSSVTGYQLVGDAYVRSVQQVKINVAFHMGPRRQRGWEDLVSMRTFELPACKGFMLHIDNGEVRALFEPEKEIDVFSTPEELCEKIRFYLTRPELRREMIERAYARCVPTHSYDTRAKVIGRLLEGGSPRPGAQSPAGRLEAAGLRS